MNQTIQPPVIFLAGPTASGKTRITLELARQFPFEVISVDAAQVYRGMDIGTAKPTLEERRQVPHRLIDIRDPAEIYSVADFRADALRAMREITAAGRIPLLSGGTMFYFNALEHGLPDLPTADVAIRTRLEAEAREVGWQVLHDRLKALDPDRAARIHPNDPQRTLRALEIIELSGRAASSYRREPVTDFPWRVIKLYLYPEDREWLHARISQRFQTMLQQGFLDEARALFARPELHPALPSLRSVGYRQVGLYLSGEINYDDLSERVVIATRQLAKRQLTWIRSDVTAERIECSQQDPLAVIRQRLHAEFG